MKNISKKTTDTVLEILNEEIKAAEGCTEPIAIALVASKAREILERIPESLTVYVSGNMIKNVKSVVVPNSGGMIGIEVAAVMGALAGDPKKDLMVISEVTEEDMIRVRAFLKNSPVKVIHEKTDVKLYVRIVASYRNESVSVEVKHQHTNITKVEKNGKIIINRPCNDADFNSALTDRSILSIDLIYTLAKTIDLDLIRPLFRKVIKLNSAIAEEGLSGIHGVNIGSCILKNIETGIYGDDKRNRCASYAASGSDARMSGCALPVMITGGSGNQGMTSSLPIIKYCKMENIDEDTMIRALMFSHLTTIHIKTNVGKLSAYCGVVCASAAVAGALALLNDADYDIVSNAIVNTLGNISGLICDGAKASCAMKIATGIYTAFDSAILAYNHKQLIGGDGIIGENVEETIKNIGELSQAGMQKTDEVILEIMSRCKCAE